jgi:hypothetical protein
MQVGDLKHFGLGNRETSLTAEPRYLLLIEVFADESITTPPLPEPILSQHLC